MIPRRPPDQAQLPLPFHPSPITQMTEEEKTTVLTVLSQLLLSAAGHEPEGVNDEH